MADVVGLQLAVGQVPHLYVLVPPSGDDDGVGIVGGEPDGGDPVLVPILLDGVLALGKGVPQLDGLVPAGGDDLPVVSGESDREHILGVVLEPPGGLASAEVPQPEGLVPGPGQGEVSVRGEHHIGDEVTKENEDQDDATRVKISSPVSVKSLLRNSIVSNIVPGQLPDNERLVSAGGHIC